MSDNRRFDLACTSLKPSLEIAFGEYKAKYYKATENRLLFAWTDVEGFVKLPVALDAESAMPIITQWLKEEAKYPEQPDHDGHNSRSWHIYNEAWGHVDRKWQVFVAIEPLWAMHGK